MFFFKPGSGEGINSHMTPKSKQSMDSVDMGYAGANNMANNGLSANQNQVRTEAKCCCERWTCFNRELKTFIYTVYVSHGGHSVTKPFPWTHKANHVFIHLCVFLFSYRFWVWSKVALTSKASASRSSNRDSVGSVWLSSSTSTLNPVSTSCKYFKLHHVVFYI